MCWAFRGQSIKLGDGVWVRWVWSNLRIPYYLNTQFPSQNIAMAILGNIRLRNFAFPFIIQGSCSELMGRWTELKRDSLYQKQKGKNSFRLPKKKKKLTGMSGEVDGSSWKKTHKSCVKKKWFRTNVCCSKPFMSRPGQGLDINLFNDLVRLQNCFCNSFVCCTSLGLSYIANEKRQTC